MWHLIKRRNTRVADESMHVQPGDAPGQSGVGRWATTVDTLLALILHWVNSGRAAGVHVSAAAHEWQRLQSDEVNSIILQDSMRYAIYV
jgi:hypothetical protein